MLVSKKSIDRVNALEEAAYNGYGFSRWREAREDLLSRIAELERAAEPMSVEEARTVIGLMYQHVLVKKTTAVELNGIFDVQELKAVLKLLEEGEYFAT